MIPVPEKFRGRSCVSPTEGAEICGVTRATFYRRVMPAVYTGEIASLMIGGCRRIVLSSLLAWLEGQTGI
jgi:hypothetical protein